MRDFYFENHIDTISDENWDDFSSDCPFHMDAYDREGRPGMYVWFDIWYKFNFRLLPFSWYIYESSIFSQPNQFFTVGYAYLREGWDFRAAILQGKRLRIMRYLIKIVFEMMVRLRDTNVENPTVTQFVVLINLDGFNLIQQACPLCKIKVVKFMVKLELN